MKIGVCFCLCFLSFNLYADYFHTPAQGWHWNTPLPQKTHVQKYQKPTKKITATQTMQAFQQYFANVKNQAVLNPTPEHVYRYLVLQHLIAHQSTRFAEVAMDVVRENPALNYDLKNPTNSATQQVIDHQRLEAQSAIARRLAQHDGLVFVYRGKNAAASMTAKALLALSSTYHFALRAISVDHVAFRLLPHTVSDSGQARALGVKATPAIFLVSPKTHQFVLLRYGYPSQNEILDDMVRVTGGQHV